MIKEKYSPENYWDHVAENINARNDLKIIAGDDEPYYRYKRKRFLELFDTIDFENKKVLEIGSGPGGNLEYLGKKNCKEIVGVDISSKMVELAKKNLSGKNIRVQKIDGVYLPFADNYFDLAFTSTVLQHNTDEMQLSKLIREICRVANSEVIIFERIETKITGHETNLGRPVEYYTRFFKDNGFNLISTYFLPIHISYYVSGAIRKICNRTFRKEGEPVSRLSSLLQKLTLRITKRLDKLVAGKRDLGMLRFKKNIPYQLL